MTSGWRRRRTAAAVAWLLASLHLGPGCAGRAQGPPPARPNILFLVVDCLRADRVVPGHYPRRLTPAIAELGGEGTLFARAFSQAGWTRPSVASLLTGLYRAEHGLGSFATGTSDAVGSEALSADVPTLAEALRAAGYGTILIAEQYQLSPQFALDQGFERYDWRAGRAAGVNARLLKAVEEMPRRPFFAYVHYLDIHRPYCPPPRTRQTFVEPASRIDTCHEWRKLHLELDLGRLRLDAADQQAMRDRYDEEILDLDLRLGELFDTLRALGLWDETLVVLTADHGEEFFEHGNQGHGDRLWDELLWVPLVVKPPGSWRAPRGARVDGLVEVRDLVPTALAAAGVRLEPGPGAVDLLPWVAGRGAAPGPRRFVVGETAAAIAVRTAEHKLVAARDGGKVELFDLVRDPGEQQDVAAEQPEAVARLRVHLEEWRSSLKPVGARPVEQVDHETVEQLKALGYIQ